MPSLSFLHVGALPVLCLLLLIHSRLSTAIFRSSMLACQAHCFITADRELACSRDRAPPTATSVPCISSPIRYGVRLVIGDFETASRIAVGGLKALNLQPGNQIHLVLNVKLDVIEMEALKEVVSLTNLTIYRSKKSTVPPCLFADAPLAGRLQLIEIHCMGVGMDLYQPVNLFVPVVKNPPVIQLRNCGVRPQCKRCLGDFSHVIWFGTKLGILTRRQRTDLVGCLERRECSAEKLKQCPGLQPKTTTVTPATTTSTLTPSTVATTTARATTTTTKTPSKNASSTTPQPAVPVAGKMSELPRRKKQMKEYQFESDRPNLSQLVNDLSKRTDRTQRFLIVILIISIINSLVLVALLIYLCRRCRLCCRNDSPRGVYVITKNPTDFDNAKAGKAT